MGDLATWQIIAAVLVLGFLFGVGFWGAGLVVARLWEAWDAR